MASKTFTRYNIGVLLIKKLIYFHWTSASMLILACILRLHRIFTATFWETVYICQQPKILFNTYDILVFRLIVPDSQVYEMIHVIVYWDWQIISFCKPKLRLRAAIIMIHNHWSHYRLLARSCGPIGFALKKYITFVFLFGLSCM